MTVRPVTADLDTGGFFAAAGRGELAVCECAVCGRALHMPRRWCHHCRQGEIRWRAVRPSGTVHSFTVVAHQVHPDFPVPYTIVLVDLDDAPGVRLAGRLEGRPEIRIGDRVDAGFRPLDDGTALPEWHLVNSSG